MSRAASLCAGSGDWRVAREGQVQERVCACARKECLGERLCRYGERKKRQVFLSVCLRDDTIPTQSTIRPGLYGTCMRSTSDHWHQRWVTRPPPIATVRGRFRGFWGLACLNPLPARAAAPSIRRKTSPNPFGNSHPWACIDWRARIIVIAQTFLVHHITNMCWSGLVFSTTFSILGHITADGLHQRNVTIR